MHHDSQYVALEEWNGPCHRAHGELFTRVHADLPEIVAWVNARFHARIYEDAYSPFCLIAGNNGEADVIHEAEYRTQVQTHSPLETHGVVADWKSDMLTVWESTQGTSSVRDELREVVDEPKSLMPTDYEKRLTAEEFQDLLAFLTRQGRALGPFGIIASKLAAFS